ncbi:gametogenetin-binding protein 2-like [Micropterus salmoides]|uniref:gametogenetin-binding protein 2-like n=1 Tax=Micropterus salmoides TaxID=27706 RepID=UPI0018EBE177|nr:gametogenetin-binding protein 2-like [Micropterus salmoides]
MARLVAVCREGEEDYPFLTRQIPLYIDDTLTMVMEFSDSVMDVDSQEINTPHWKQFSEYHSKLKQQDLNIALMVTSREVYSAISAGAMCGLQTKRGASLLTFSGIREPGPGAPHTETHRHALCHQDLFSRRKEALHPLLCPWVRYKIMWFFIFTAK